MSERRDSNPESPLPKRGMLAVTPRSVCIILTYHRIIFSIILTLAFLVSKFKYTQIT